LSTEGKGEFLDPLRIGQKAYSPSKPKSVIRRLVALSRTMPSTSSREPGGRFGVDVERQRDRRAASAIQLAQDRLGEIADPRDRAIGSSMILP
jgi:hypothetical protein